MSKRKFAQATEDEIVLCRQQSFAKKTVYGTSSTESHLVEYFCSLSEKNNKAASVRKSKKLRKRLKFNISFVAAILIQSTLILTNNAPLRSTSTTFYVFLVYAICE